MTVLIFGGVMGGFTSVCGPIIIGGNSETTSLSLSLSLSQHEIRQMTHTGGDKEINIIHENPGF